MTTPEYLIDSILPSGEIHLLGGPSGAGKSRWLFDTLLTWQDGLPILGFASHPTLWVYVATDRSLKSVRRTLTQMGIDPARIPIIPAWDEKMNIYQIQDEVDRQGAHLAVIESFGSFVDPPGNSQCVKKFLNPIGSNWCQKQDKTILGVMESPKSKPYEKYENPRQRISGAAGWAHYCETIFLIEPTNVKDPTDPHRTFSCCPRNASGMELSFRFNSVGRLECMSSVSR